MTEVDQIISNIDSMINTLNSTKFDSEKSRTIIDQLEEEKQELVAARDETKPVQQSVSTTVKKNILYILSELNDNEFSTLLDSSDLSDSFEYQIRSEY